jgi:hypothetical protein
VSALVTEVQSITIRGEELTTRPSLECCAGSVRIGIFFRLPLFSSGNANLHNGNLLFVLDYNEKTF